MRYVRQISDACGTDEKDLTPTRHLRLLYETFATPAAPMRQLRHLCATCGSYATPAAPTRHLRHLCDTCGTYARFATPLRGAARCATTQRRSDAAQRGVTRCSGATRVSLATCSARANIFSAKPRVYIRAFSSAALRGRPSENARCWGNFCLARRPCFVLGPRDLRLRYLSVIVSPLHTKYVFLEVCCGTEMRPAKTIGNSVVGLRCESVEQKTAPGTRRRPISRSLMKVFGHHTHVAASVFTSV